MRFTSLAAAAFVVLLGALWAQPARAAAFAAFADGETFTYRVGWGIFPRAGEIVIAAHEEKDERGDEVFHITTDTATRGFVREFYSYNNRAEAIIDRRTGRLTFMREKGSDGGQHRTDTETTFDYVRNIAWHVDHFRPDRSQQVTIPPGDPIDLISALVQTREWNLKPGQKKDVLVNFSNEFYPLAIYADHYEEARTPLGTYRALVLIPRMEQNPKGIFRRGGEIKVWISQGEQKLPVKMQLKLRFGSAVLWLSKYQAAAPAAPPPAKPPG
ncbi:MAG TPA: DUF3108 domain-containing protein [Opitutaceae bacterium]|nr:DUF3108 domain-containing protein [Opitutaceae bacterium]